MIKMKSLSVLLLITVFVTLNCGEAGNKTQGQGWLAAAGLNADSLKVEWQVFLDVNVDVKTEMFSDFVTDESYPSLQLDAVGSGHEFPDVFTVIDGINKKFTTQSWDPNWQYSADGPDGTLFGYQKANILCLINIQWEPAAGVELPQDQIVDLMTLPPDQRHYSIQIKYVNKGEAPDSQTQ
jgi:hypothetical protein